MEEAGRMLPQADQYVFFASGDAGYVQWTSRQARDEFVVRVKDWYREAAANGGEFPDGSRIDPRLPQPTLEQAFKYAQT